MGEKTSPLGEVERYTYMESFSPRGHAGKAVTGGTDHGSTTAIGGLPGVFTAAGVVVLGAADPWKNFVADNAESDRERG